MYCIKVSFHNLRVEGHDEQKFSCNMGMETIQQVAQTVIVFRLTSFGIF